MLALPLPEYVARVNASTDPKLGVTTAMAHSLMLEIERTDATDDDSLAAYDLLHSRATFGRAF